MKEHKTLITPEKSVKHEIAKNIVNQIETLLSAASWQCFKKQGRGYLFLHRSIDVEHVAGNTFEIQEKPTLEKDILYFARNGELWNNAKKSEAASGQTKEWEKFYSLVDSYNPRYEFLVVIGFNEGDRATEHWFLVEPKVSPFKARLNFLRLT